METLIALVIWIIVFAIVAYGLLWVCDHFGLPQPVKWLCGAILLIVLLYAIAGQFGGGSARFPAWR